MFEQSRTMYSSNIAFTGLPPNHGLRAKEVDQYTRIMGDIQALFRSRLQIQILLALADGTKTLSQLRDITGSSSQALIPKIRKLESSNFMAISD